MRFRPSPASRLISRAAVLPLVALTVLTTFACSLDKLTRPATTAQTLAATVAGDTVVAVGATLPLAIQTTAGAVTNSVAVVWSSDKASIATVNASTGVVTGVAIGTATISAKLIAPELGEVTAKSLTIRVRYAAISIKPVDSLIAIGMTKAIDVRGASPTGVAGASIPFSAALTIVSRDPTIFDVDNTGALVAKKNGSARVFVQYDGLKDSAIVKVRQVTRALTFVGAVAGELPVGSLNKDRTYTVTAADSLGVAITAPTVTWGTADATTMTIGAATGIARALKIGTVVLTATSDGFARTITARIIQVPATLTKTTGSDGLSAVVNTAVSVAPGVTVLDSGSTAVPATPVTFTVASGGGSVTGATPTSSATGVASATSWILGTTAGTNTLVATAGAASATFTATGTFGLAKKLAFTVQPAPSAINTVIPSIKVSVVDSLNNVVTTATNTIALALGSGAGTLGGTVSVAAVAGVASFNNITLNTAGFFTLIGSATGLSAATSNSFAIFGTPTQLIFSTQPVGGTAGQPLTQFKVSIADVGGNVVGNATNTITLAITTATGATGAVLSGTISVPAVAGVATFTTASIDKQGTGYKVSASTTGFTTVTSTAFTVDPVGPPAKLGFVVQPSNVVAGAAIAPSIQVAIQDAGGVTATSSTLSVTLAFETNVGSSTITGTVTQPAVAGIATFPGIILNKVGTAYKLNATSGALAKAVSSAFNVTPGAVTQLKFLVQPSNAVTATAMAPAVQVALQDASGNTVTTATNPIALATSGGGGGTLSGGTAVPAVAGVASFSALAVSLAGANYQLVASSTGLTNLSSTTFNVVSSTSAIKLAFVTQPSNVASKTAMTPSVQVAVQDNSGNTVTSVVTVTLSIGANPSNGALIGASASAQTSGGIATFTDVEVNLVGSGYTLVAAATGLNSATSSAFNVTPGAAAKVGIVTQPSNIVAGASITPDVQVAVQDVSGNTVPTATNIVTLSLSGNAFGGSLRGTTSLAATAGVATFTGVSVNRAGTGYTVFANSSGLSGSSVSIGFDVTAAPASALSYKTQPANVAAGALQTNAIQVQIVDPSGNVITTATDPITLAIGSGPTGGVITGTKTINAVAGVATFTDLKFNTSGNYTLAATAAGLATTTSFGFNVSAGPAAGLAWGVTPVSGIRNKVLLGAGSANPRVDVVDAFGNTVTSTAPITVSISTNPSSATLGGTATQNASFGSSFYNDLTINAAGAGYKLTAASTGLTSAVSASFDIAAFGTASQLAFVVPPTSTTGGMPFSPALQVGIVDQSGNVVTTAAVTTIQLFIGNNPGSSAITGTTVTTTTNGIATFSNVAVSKVGTGYTLQAGTVAATPSFFGESGAFNITVGAAAKLDFNVQPSNTTGGIAFNPAVKVAITDLGGNVVSTVAATPITVALTVPGTATLSGTKTVSTASGVATFTGLSVDKQNTYSLTATGGGFTAAQSQDFFIATGPAAKLAFTQQPAATTFVNAPLNPSGQVNVEVQDAGGNTIFNASDVVTFAIGTNPGSGTLNGTKVSTASFGTASVNNDVSLSAAGTGYTITATASNLATATSATFNVAAFSTATKLAFVVQPTSNVSATPLSPAPKVAVEDQYSNVVTSGASSTSLISIFTNSGPGSAGGTSSVAAVNGIATFSNLTFATSGTYNLFAAVGSSLFSDNSASFVITPTIAATATASMYDVAINGTNAFYLERGASGSLKQVSLTTGTQSTLVPNGINFGGGVVSDGVNVYWIEDANNAVGGTAGLVKKVPIGGGTVVTMSTGMANVASYLQTDGTSLYFIANNAALTQREIKKLANTVTVATVPTPVFTATCGTTCLPIFALSGSTIIASNGSTAILSMTNTGASQSTLVSSLTAAPITITVSASTIVWGTANSILSAPIAGGSAVSRATPAALTRLAINGSSLYGLDGTNLRRYALSDFSLTTLATTTAGTASVALAFDNTYVFWADNAAPPNLRRLLK